MLAFGLNALSLLVLSVCRLDSAKEANEISSTPFQLQAAADNAYQSGLPCVIW